MVCKCYGYSYALPPFLLVACFFLLNDLDGWRVMGGWGHLMIRNGVWDDDTLDMIWLAYSATYPPFIVAMVGRGQSEYMRWIYLRKSKKEVVEWIKEDEEELFVNQSGVWFVWLARNSYWLFCMQIAGTGDICSWWWIQHAFKPNTCLLALCFVIFQYWVTEVIKGRPRTNKSSFRSSPVPNGVQLTPDWEAVLSSEN